MASKFTPGDRVRAKSAWTGRSNGKGTVATVTGDIGPDGCGVVLDSAETEHPAHFYDSELTKVRQPR